MRQLIISIATTAFVVCALLITASPAKAWEGKYERGSDIQLSLNKSPTTVSQYTGEITIQGATYPVRLQASDNRLSGTFSIKEKAFPLNVVKQDDAFVLTSGRATYKLTKLASPNRPSDNPLENLDPDDATPAPTPTPQTANFKGLESLAIRPDANRAWTILVYIAADNNLEQFGINDINEMEKGLPSSGAVEVIALIDRAKGHDKREGDWTDARVYRIKKDNDLNKINSELLANLGEVNLGDPGTIENFTHHAFRAFPARQRMFIMWNHGGGWASQAHDEDNGKTPPGDDDVKLAELRSGLSKGMKSAGVKHIDIVGFDMCLMAQIETAMSLRGIAKIMVASQNLEPGHGWPYDALLPAFGDRVKGGRGLAQVIVQEFDKYYDNIKTDDTTLSAVDLELLDDATKSLDALATKLTENIDTSWTTIARAFFFGESYGDRLDFRSGANGYNSLDLLDVFKRIRHELKPFNAEAEFSAFREAIDRFVITSVVNPKRRLSNGISIYAPVLSSALHREYANEAFAKACPGWLNLLKAVHAEQAKDTSPITFKKLVTQDSENKPIAAVTPFAGHKFVATINGKNIAWTRVLDGVREEDGLRVQTASYLTDDAWLLEYEKRMRESTHEADLVMPRYKDGDTTVHSEFEGLNLKITNGAKDVVATLVLDNIVDTNSIHVDGLLQVPDSNDAPIFVSMVFGAVSFQCEAMTAKLRTQDGGMQAQAVALEKIPPDATITFLDQFITNDGKIEARKGAELTWQRGLGLFPTLTDAGSYRVIARAEKMNGQAGVKHLDYEVTKPNAELFNLLENWKRFQPDQMIGKWSIGSFDENGKVVPLPMSAVVEGRKGDIYSVTFTSPDGPARHVWRLHSRGMPTLQMIELTDKGTTDGNMLCPAFWGRSPEGKPRLLLQVLSLGGMLWVLEREEADTGGTEPGPEPEPGPGPNDEARYKPVQTPDPVPLR